MKGLLVIALALLGIASSEPIRHKFNSRSRISVRDPVGKCPPTDPANPVYLPDSEDCGYYYECSNGIPVENNCPPDLEFNPSKNVCTQCQESGCKAAIRHCASEPPITTTPPVETTPSLIEFYEVNGECPKHDTNETIILPDAHNCTVYYLCSNGRAIPNVCPPGTLFNPEESVCVAEVDYECTLKPEEQYVKLVRKPDGVCPERDPTDESVFLPDKEDCTIYYECSNGIAIPMECPDNTYFNPSLNVCDDTGHAGCKASTSTSTTSSTTSAPTTTEETTDLTTSSSFIIEQYNVENIVLALVKSFKNNAA